MPLLEASCLLVIRIGRPGREPWFAQVRLRCEGGRIPPELEQAARAELELTLADLPALTSALVDGTVRGY